MDGTNRLVGDVGRGFGNAYADANILQKAIFHMARYLLRVDTVFSLLHQGSCYLAAVLEFDSGGFAIMMGLNAANIYEPWGALDKHSVPAQPARGPWLDRAWHKAAVVVLGPPLLLAMPHPSRRRAIIFFRALARRGAFVRTYI